MINKLLIGIAVTGFVTITGVYLANQVITRSKAERIWNNALQ